MNLTIANLDFGVCLYGGSELSKHLSKCLPLMQKTPKIEPDPNFFYDGRKFQRQCVNLINITWGRNYFSTCEQFGLSVQWPLFSNNMFKCGWLFILGYLNCLHTSATRTLCCIFFLDFMIRTIAASISCFRSSSTFCRVSFLSGSDSPCLAATAHGTYRLQKNTFQTIN